MILLKDEEYWSDNTLDCQEKQWVNTEYGWEAVTGASSEKPGFVCMKSLDFDSVDLMPGNLYHTILHNYINKLKLLHFFRDN